MEIPDTHLDYFWYLNVCWCCTTEYLQVNVLLAKYFVTRGAAKKLQNANFIYFFSISEFVAEVVGWPIWLCRSSEHIGTHLLPINIIWYIRSYGVLHAADAAAYWQEKFVTLVNSKHTGKPVMTLVFCWHVFYSITGLLRQFLGWHWLSGLSFIMNLLVNCMLMC